MSLSLLDHLSEKGIDKWVAAAGVSNAALARHNVREALGFFARHMSTLKPELALSFILCMDLSKPVSAVHLKADERLIAFRVPTEDPFKLFYSRRGSSKYNSGINHANRSANSFRVRQPCISLESTTCAAKDTWTRPLPGQPMSFSPRNKGSFGVMVEGGVVQLIVPNSHTYLVYEP